MKRLWGERRGGGAVGSLLSPFLSFFLCDDGLLWFVLFFVFGVIGNMVGGLKAHGKKICRFGANIIFWSDFSAKPISLCLSISMLANPTNS